MSFSCSGCGAAIIMVLNDGPEADRGGRPRLYIDHPPTSDPGGGIAATQRKSRRYGLHPTWQGHRAHAGESVADGYQLYAEHSCSNVVSVELVETAQPQPGRKTA